MIYEFDDYKSYVLNRLGGKGRRTGLRKKLAEHMAVHTTFISQVLADKAHFSLEQAEAANEFFDHTNLEAEYFLFLLMRDRAGTAKLRERLQGKIEKIRSDQLNIANRLRPDDEVSEANKQRFYSSWIYGAAHVLSSIEKFQTPTAMAQALSVSRQKCIEILEFLNEIGLVSFNGNRAVPGSRHVHLDKESSLVLQHHKNWRSHSLNRLNFEDSDDLRYAACLSLSEKDVLVIKEMISRNIEENIQKVIESKEETAYVYNIDFYKLY